MIQAVLKIIGVHSNLSRPIAEYHTRSAMCGRYVGGTAETLKAYIEENNISRLRILPWLSFQLRLTPLETLEYSLHELAFGENFPDRQDSMKSEFLEMTDTQGCNFKKKLIFEIYIADWKATTCI